MTFLPITSHDQLSAEAMAAVDRELAASGGSVTNLNVAMLGDVASFRAALEWYSLRDQLVPFIGERAVSLFAYAISDENDSLVCSAFFRKALVDAGEDVENPEVTEAEQLLMDWGRLIARSPNAIPEDVYQRLEGAFSSRLRIILVAFAGQVIAANVITTVGRTPLDESLFDFRRPGDTRVN
jgi:alkylhydroperoxidase family enzyme